MQVFRSRFRQTPRLLGPSVSIMVLHLMAKRFSHSTRAVRWNILLPTEHISLLPMRISSQHTSSQDGYTAKQLLLSVRFITVYLRVPSEIRRTQGRDQDGNACHGNLRRRLGRRRQNYQVRNALAECNMRRFDLCNQWTVKDEKFFAQLCPRTRCDWSNNYCDRPYASFFSGSEDESHHFKCKKCCVDAWITRDRDTENEHQYWLSEVSEYLSMRGSCLKIITEEVYRKDYPN